jgi:hypothetical protein
MTPRSITGAGALSKLEAWVFLLERGRLFFAVIWSPFVMGRCGAIAVGTSALVKLKFLLLL